MGSTGVELRTNYAERTQDGRKQLNMFKFFVAAPHGSVAETNAKWLPQQRAPV